MIFNCIICSCENVCTLLKNELKNRVLDIYFNPKKKKFKIFDNLNIISKNGPPFLREIKKRVSCEIEETS